MKIFLASDHAAFLAKRELFDYLKERFEVVDCGTHSEERCDYPDFAQEVAVNIQKNEADLGIILCGSGIGVSMVANRFKGVRAALCRSVEDAHLAKAHNNSNCLCLGSRTSSTEEIHKIVDSFLNSSFEEGRHLGRIEKFNGLGESL